MTIPYPDEIALSRNLVLNDRNNLEICPSCHPEETSQFSVSIWRRATYDTVFAVRKGKDLLPVEIMCGKRSLEGSKSLELSFLEKIMRVTLSSGRAAEGSVVVRRIVPVEKPTSNSTDVSIYGLYQVVDGSEELYDLLALDSAVRSLNSLFGVRSLSWGGLLPGGGRQHVLATFNNNFSLPSSHLPPSWGHKFGQLLPFELLSEKNECRLKNDGEVDPGDPDTGVWVGVVDP
ncbi:MAG: hypothetical protein AAGC60_16360 [Acidobacteriota bacterium]